jgi:hypothetical protein
MPSYPNSIPSATPHPIGSARHRHKGSRIEREIVELHKALGVHAERPLSGASRFRGNSHDIDLGRRKAGWSA